MSEKYLSPSFEAGKHLFSKNIQGAITNLNLIRLKKQADYSEYPDLKPDEITSGWDAYFTYIRETEPYLRESGGEILFIGKGDQFLIGPEREYWDLCLLIRQKSVNNFFGFERDEAYMKIIGHRMAAVEDSRLLPLEEVLLNEKRLNENSQN